MYELGFYLSWTGLTEPQNQVGSFDFNSKSGCNFRFLQVYLTAKPGPKLTELLFLSVIGHLAKEFFAANAGGLMAKRVQDHVDAHPFLLGMLCLLRQFPQQITDGLLEYVAQYTRSFIADHTK